ncbi:DevC protein [Chroococcidiopsis sp. CCALA 051]|uniref:ABC transporter permease DevC n=1 Tax=Chroococcidiopsis sp. CCALA 051 TaxID=869949 RepID=UPI000D0D6FD4|nr:ABC transporter permease DevC [Chroococcidiopsis sp. CCALA 051]MBE9017361.1 FtsX-like permease family protein [Chroococcidiopsidales cyanobacterium LEGE 13417]PSM48662.1 DevC protein [Chroococcidiopsis sp. CCALA 051]
MLPPRHTPLAWFNLTHEKRRLLTAVAGVSFAVLLMFIFQGFENALYDSQVQLLKRLNGEILIVNRLKYNMFVPEQFARRRLYQAQTFEGVVAAYPFYTTTGDWKNPQTKTIRPLRVIAFNPDDPVLPLPGILQNREALKLPWTALIDDQSRSEVGPIAPGTVTELSEQQIRLVGTFSLGTDFASGNGNVVISDQNFLRYFANLAPEEDSRTLNTVDIGLLKVAENADVDAIASALRQQLPQDVAVWTKAEFVQKELSYWQENTAIGFVFSLLTTMGFFVGIILVYQILYTDVAEHWAEYATLKAIGYSNFHLLGIVLQESVILVFFGFVPGFFISLGLYSLTASSTGLLMQMTWERAINILIATFIMCLISGAIAVRKVQATDPAEVFGS